MLNIERVLFKDGRCALGSPELVKELAKLGLWVRLHYVYPYPHVDELFELMAQGLVLP